MPDFLRIGAHQDGSQSPSGPCQAEQVIGLQILEDLSRNASMSRTAALAIQQRLTSCRISKGISAIIHNVPFDVSTRFAACSLSSSSALLFLESLDSAFPAPALDPLIELREFRVIAAEALRVYVVKVLGCCEKGERPGVD